MIARPFYVAIWRWNRSTQDVRYGSSAHDDNKDAQRNTKDSDDKGLTKRLTRTQPFLKTEKGGKFSHSIERQPLIALTRNDIHHVKLTAVHVYNVHCIPALGIYSIWTIFLMAFTRVHCYCIVLKWRVVGVTRKVLKRQYILSFGIVCIQYLDHFLDGL